MRRKILENPLLFRLDFAIGSKDKLQICKRGSDLQYWLSFKASKSTPFTGFNQDFMAWQKARKIRAFLLKMTTSSPMPKIS